MSNKQQHIELVENIIKNSPGFKGNEDLIEEMTFETLRKGRSFLDSSSEVANLEIYLKKIANSVIVDIVKNADVVREEKIKRAQIQKDFQEVKVAYKTDKEGKIVYKPNIPEFKEKRPKKLFNDEQASNIRKRVCALDKENPSRSIKQVFELRFIKEMSQQEIAKKLEMKETEVSGVLLEIFDEIDLV